MKHVHLSHPRLDFRVTVEIWERDGRYMATADLGTVLLVGDGAYEGLIAYLSIELDWEVNVFESQVRGLILAADPPPMPEPIEPSAE